jgi:O-antigen chain-terminating methyltransferase
MNRDMVALCVERGHQAIHGNALEVLRTLPDASLLGVTAFHVVEHISPESALELLAEIYRCLVPGGIALFETPNPENIRTATNNFFLDPTHLRPVPPMLLQFMFEFCGFTGNEIVRLRPVPGKGWRWRMASSASRFVLKHFLKEQDYAVIGVKGPVPPGLLPAIESSDP